MTRIRFDRRIAWLVASPSLTGLVLLFILCSRGTNCGNMSAAAAGIWRYPEIVKDAADRRPDRVFTIASAATEDRQRLWRMAESSSITSGQILATTLPYDGANPGPQRILIVWDRPFGRMRRGLLFDPPPTHEVAYSDGTSGWISVASFAALDLSTFRPLEDILAATEPPAAP